jgi:hypothetical protein
MSIPRAPRRRAQTARWFLLFLLMTMVGFGMAFYALYRQDRDKFAVRTPGSPPLFGRRRRRFRRRAGALGTCGWGAAGGMRAGPGSLCMGGPQMRAHKHTHTHTRTTSHVVKATPAPPPPYHPPPKDFANLWHSFCSMFSFLLAMFDYNVGFGGEGLFGFRGWGEGVKG